MRTLVQRRCHLTTEQECCSSCCSQPPALQCSGGVEEEGEEEVCELCVLYVPHDLMLMKRLDGSGIVHCDN